MIKKQYYQTESTFLQRYERKLNDAQGFFSLSATDDSYFTQLYPTAQHDFIAPFHPYETVVSTPGRGSYCLYHGNLSHAENIEAAIYLLTEVFSKINVPLIVAGRKPAKEIINACAQLSNCKLVADPGAEQMEQLVKEAQVHVLPTFQATGMKLKLLYALFSGRHVLVNSPMLHGTGLNGCCSVADTAQDMQDRINDLMDKAFTKEDIDSRSALLSAQYNNRKNAARLLTYLQH